jgi:mono/diheme cytochrome c family protein
MNKKVTHVFSLLAIYSCVAIGFVSCSKHDPNSPGVEYMPDMYRSPSLETNMYTLVANGHGGFDTIASNLKPVKGTIARGYMPYTLENNAEGYLASAARINPIASDAKSLAEGEVLYNKYCTHCHGASGEGDGLVGAKLPGAPPSYKTTLKDLPAGTIFHSITYGKGLMGSHASQLSQTERWKVVLHVQKLQGKITSDSTAVPVPDSVAVAVKK